MPRRIAILEYFGLLWSLVLVAVAPCWAQVGAANRPELALQIGHNADLTSVVFSSDNKTIVSASGDHTVGLWDASTGEMKRQLKGHKDRVNSVAISPDGKIVVSGGNDSTIRLWDTSSGKLTHTIKDKAAINSVAVSPDGKTIASGGDDGSVKLWDSQTGKLKRTITGQDGSIHCVVFSSDGTLLASGGAFRMSGGFEMSSSIGGRVTVWNVTDGRVKWASKGKFGEIFSIAFSPNNKSLASGGSIFQKAHSLITQEGFPEEGGELRIWDAHTGMTQQVIRQQQDRWNGAIQTVAYSPDGSTIATNQQDNKIQIRDGRSGQIKRILTGELRPETEEGAVHCVNSLAFSPNGKMVAGGSSDSTLKRWEAKTGKLKRVMVAFNDSISSASFTPEGNALITSDEVVTGSGNILGSTVRLWDLSGGKLQNSFGKEVRQIRAIAIAHEGRAVAVANDDGIIKLRELTTGRLLLTLEANKRFINSVVFSTDDKFIVGSSSRATINDKDTASEICVWDASTGKITRRMTEKELSVNSIALSPDNKMIAAAAGDGNVILWDLTTGKKVKTMGPQWVIELAPDGKTELSRTRINDIGLVTSLAYSPDGKMIIAGSGTNSSWGKIYGGLRSWSLDSGAAVEWQPKLSSPVEAVAFSPDGKTVVSSSSDGMLQIWNVETDAIRFVMSGHNGCVLSISISPDSQVVASTSEDGTIKLWNAQFGRELATLLIRPSIKSSDPASWIITTPEGYYTCSEGADQYIKWLFQDRLVPFSDFEETFRRPDLVRRAMRGEVITEKPLTLDNIAPQCEFVQPVALDTVTGDSVHVQVEATDDKDVREMELYVNGVKVPQSVARPIRADSRPIRAGSRPIRAGSREVPDEHKISRTFTADIPLPEGAQDVKIRAVVYDDERLKSEATIQIHRANVKPILGDLHVLTVGVSHYRNPKYNLNFAAQDAQSLADLFRGQEGKEYSHVHVHLLTDDKATADGLRAALQEIKQETTSSADTVLVFLAGHGANENGKFYFAPHGVVVNDIEGTCVAWQEILDALSGIYAKKVLFADACHSGAKLDKQATNEQLQEATRRSGVVMLASSSGEEYSYENAASQHGAFTAGLLEAFRGGADLNKDGSVTLPELEIYIAGRVPELTSGAQHPHLIEKDFDPQTPLVKLK